MEVTSLDGSPSNWQRFLVWRMRFFKPLIIRDTFEKSVFLKSSFEVSKYILTIGLSGFLIYLFTLLDFDKPKEKIPQIEELIKNQVEIIKSNKSLNSKIDSLLILEERDKYYKTS